MFRRKNGCASVHKPNRSSIGVNVIELYWLTLIKIEHCVIAMPTDNGQNKTLWMAIMQDINHTEGLTFYKFTHNVIVQIIWRKHFSNEYLLSDFWWLFFLFLCLVYLSPRSFFGNEKVFTQILFEWESSYNQILSETC